MRKLTVVVKPFKLDAAVRALLEIGVVDLHVIEARGYGRQKGHLDLYRDEPGRVTFLPKARIECGVADGSVEVAIEAVLAAARTGRIGDGKVFVEALQ